MQRHFEQPSPVERVFNRVFGAIVRLGGGLKHNHLLEVQGRKSGKLYSTPVNVLEHQGKLWLIAPRGETQWVRNARANPVVTLVRGRQRTAYRLKLVPAQERAPLLREYLERYHPTVQRYFSVQRGAELQAFEAVAERYPTFELVPVTS